MKSRAFVVAAGARTALGQTAVQTAFLLRTGVAAIAPAPLIDGAGEPVTMSFDPTLDPYLVGEPRAAALAAPALAEALAPLSLSFSFGEVIREQTARLLLCVDSAVATDAHGEAAEAARIAARVHARARELAPGIELSVTARGAAGAAFALTEALDDLASGSVDLLVLGGVHSDYDPEIIASLAARGRLFGPENLDALIPGEAAAFVVLAREETARRAGLSAAARLSDLGTGMERARPDNDDSAFSATGLISAVRAATDEMAREELRVGWTLTDQTFELPRLHEWQAMMTRAHALFCPPHQVESPAQRLGRLGAAAMPLQMALVTEGFRRGYAPSGIALCLAGSDSGERGAILMLTNV
jgi:3-oxoacyl-[acyl-carrier-protein] synthase-1